MNKSRAGRTLAPELARRIRALARAQPPSGKNAIEGQPFDRLLLNQSRIYRKSRSLFARIGGRHMPALLSSSRSLSSGALVTNVVQYSPIEHELIWAADAEIGRLEELRTWVTSVFHEQNHRILWKILPPPARPPAALRRFLNFSESLVVMLDMALGDELGPELARGLWLAGPVYDPGSTARAELQVRRVYRNYLQAAVLATYLNLEHRDPRDIPGAVRATFPFAPDVAERAAKRAGNLDRAFIDLTNPLWQRRHGSTAHRALSRRECTDRAPLELPADLLDSRLIYLWGERVLDEFGI